MNTNMTGFNNLCVLVLWTKVASALEGLKGENSVYWINSQGLFSQSLRKRSVPVVL